MEDHLGDLEANTSTWLTKTEAAKWLHLSERFVERLISERRIAYHKMGKFVRLNSSDLEKFAVEGRVEPLRSSPVPKLRRRR